MKLCTLLTFSLVLGLSENAHADVNPVESKAQTNAVQQVNPQTVDATEASSTSKITEQAEHRHDVLKTQFLGKRPYMETKAK